MVPDVTLIDEIVAPRCQDKGVVRLYRKQRHTRLTVGAATEVKWEKKSRKEQTFISAARPHLSIIACIWLPPLEPGFLLLSAQCLPWSKVQGDGNVGVEQQEKKKKNEQ